MIPVDFPLGRGLPTASQQLDMRGVDTPPTGESVGAICGEPYALTGRPVDRAAIEGTNQEYLGVRDLAVYGTPAEALDADADAGRPAALLPGRADPRRGHRHHRDRR